LRVVSRRKRAAVIVHVHFYSQANLSEIIQTLDDFRPLLGAAQGRQQQRGKNGNDRDDDQQLDERE